MGKQLISVPGCKVGELPTPPGSIGACSGGHGWLGWAKILSMASFAPSTC